MALRYKENIRCICIFCVIILLDRTLYHMEREREIRAFVKLHSFISDAEYFYARDNVRFY